MLTEESGVITDVEQAFIEATRKATDKLTADYQRNPPPGKTAGEVAAYCEGFREATAAYTAAYLAGRRR